MNRRDVLQVVVRWLPGGIILSYTIAIMLQQFTRTTKMTQFQFLWGSFFLLVVLPLMFAIQGISSAKAETSKLRDFGASLVIWMLSGILLAPETWYIYSIIYTLAFWIGAWLIELFKLTYRKVQ